MKRLGWGIWGAGEIAHDFALGLASSTTGKLVHVAARRLEAARELAGLEARASSELEALLDDAEVDVVYIATPHTLHEEAALSAIARGKSVLVEKPLTTSSEATGRILEAARQRGVLALEGYMYRCQPVLSMVADCLRSGAVGRVRHIRADFGFATRRRAGHRLFEPTLGGGGIWDIGGYTATFAQWVAGLALGRPFAEVESAAFSGVVGPSGVDELALAQLGFAGGVSAQLGCSIGYSLGTRAQVFGDEGVLELPNPWLPLGQRQGRHTSFSVQRNGHAAEEHHVTQRPVFALEADGFAAALEQGLSAWPSVTPDESLATSRLLERWRAALR